MKKFGKDTVSDRMYQRWLKNFKTGNFNLNGRPYSERLSLAHNDINNSSEMKSVSYHHTEIFPLVTMEILLFSKYK